MGKDLGACVSLVVGVFCTQIYLQSLFAARDAATARRGASGPPSSCPPWVFWGSGWVWRYGPGGWPWIPPRPCPGSSSTPSPLGWRGSCGGSLFITVVGCAAGLALGMGTNLARDLLLPLGRRMGRPEPTPQGEIRALRLCVLGVVLAAALLGAASEGSLILQWSYLSMGLRGAGTFFPLVLAVRAPGRLSPPWAPGLRGGGDWGSASCGPLTNLQGEPLFWGLALSGLLCLGGLRASRSQRL